MRVTSPVPTIANLAAKYGCCNRTILRMKRRGVDVLDPQAVAVAVIENRCPRPAMVIAVSAILRNTPPEIQL